MSFKPIDAVKASKSEKETEKTPISQMSISEVSEKRTEYSVQVEENSDDIYDLIKVIKPSISEEELEGLLYGFVEDKKEVVLLKSENNDKLEGLTVEYGKNAFRGVFAIERLSELGLGVDKQELSGKTVKIPITHWKVQTELKELEKRCYWLLYYGLQIKKCDKRIRRLSTSKKEDNQTKLEDLLPSSDTSDKEVSTSSKRKTKRKTKKGSK